MWKQSSRRYIHLVSTRKDSFIESVSTGNSVLSATPRLARGIKSSIHPQSSVLVPVVETKTSTGDSLSVVLTKRSSLLKAHRGEVCFPGGKCDEGETLEETAIRETHEEIGIDSSQLEIWSRLLPVVTSKFDRQVMPIVAEIKDQSSLHRLNLNYDEVTSVFSVPVSHLISIVSSTLFVHPQYKFRLPLFRVRQFTVHAQSKSAFIPREYCIWGLSAIILHQTLSHLEPTRYEPFKVRFY